MLFFSSLVVWGQTSIFCINDRLSTLSSYFFQISSLSHKHVRRCLHMHHETQLRRLLIPNETEL
ncbi:hypothetical protein B0F90DRAFT_1755331 [Multifurca ochricompacta]|uniref:Uncharacterized protein n=1 Tax=Multifurca ochricompacta TaxID=376703 RepID=A0AAD4LYN5_9AGAM|nr:hypothetical protein B0F90DRAFT_1755331 [Multifurca ochricompacta]